MTRSGPADMTPEGPAHLVAWSWRCRMVGSPTVAAGTPPYPLLGSGRERFSGGASELLCSGEHPSSPDWILPYSPELLLGRELAGPSGANAQLGSSAIRLRWSPGQCRSGPGCRLVPAQPSPGSCRPRPSSVWSGRQACMELPSRNCSAGKQGHHTII